MMGHRLLYIFILMGMFSGAFSQNKYTLSGTIADAESGEDLAGAVLSVQNTSYNTICNPYGFYSITIPEGRFSIEVQFVGYENQLLEVDLHSSQVINFRMKSVAYELENIEVRGKSADHNVTSLGMGSLKLNPKQIENIPVLFGERDLIKTMQLLPGIKQAGEGNAGFYVRGGGLDQNLILLDEAPVYNASHLLGFFSVFNSEAIRDAELLKGSIPAEYGGRASSVLDIRMKEGNMKDYHTTGNVGLIASNLSFEGPVKEYVSSFMVSARRTYADLFLNFAPDKDLRETQLYFYDLNLKTNFKLNEANRLFISGYLGRDKFRMEDQFGFDWGSKTATVRLNHTFNEKLFSNSSLIFSNYSYEIDLSGDNDVLLGSVIQDFNLKQDFSWYLNAKNTLKFGANLIFHKIVPGEVKTSPGSVYSTLAVRPRRALESAFYISNSQKISDRLKIYYGLRLALFSNVGPGDFYSFDSNGDFIKTNSYDRFKWVKTQGGPEPRLALNYLIDSKSAVKGSYNRIYQFIHLLSNSTSSTPTDVWLPSSDNVRPQISDQWSVGYFRNSNRNAIESSVELYYKNLQNQIDYRNGADLVFNSTVEAELVFGRGWAYGAEFLFRKNEGKLTGWLGYTWSRTMRQFDEINQPDQNSKGLPFPARQDMQHDISVVAMYDLTRNLKISATWVYNTGNAVTFPNGKYEVDGRIVGYYTQRNGYRMPDYHRLDLGLIWIRKQTARFESSWNFSVYNAYGRENAYFISFRQNKENPELTEAVQISLFKIIPSVSYKFKF
ncbi:MAG: TonB-dependent receptor [Prolixibacteraceae bacterium]|nr:TonB-dependent receptor [Prolixibacteraceae bacterium]